MPLIFTVYAVLHHVKCTLASLTASQSIRVDDSTKMSFRYFFWEVFCTICQILGMFCTYFPFLKAEFG